MNYVLKSTFAVNFKIEILIGIYRKNPDIYWWLLATIRANVAHIPTCSAFEMLFEYQMTGSWALTPALAPSS